MKINYGLFIIFVGCLTIPSVAVQNYDILLPSYPPNGIVTGPAGLNDLNQIAGPANGMPAAPYLWHNGTLTELPMLSGFEYLYHDVNNAGHIVGSDGNSAGFLWNGTQIIRLGTLGGSPFYGRIMQSFRWAPSAAVSDVPMRLTIMPLSSASHKTLQATREPLFIATAP
jgi:probable HAF family extracellular repeat protein